MNRIGIMIGTYLFETIDDAHMALGKYGMIEGTCETFIVRLPEKVYNIFIEKTRKEFPL